MWQRMIAGWMVVSLVMLGAPMGVLAGYPKRKTSSQVIPYSGPSTGQNAVSVVSSNQALVNQAGQARGAIQNGTIGTATVKGPDGSRSVITTQSPKVIGQDAISYRQLMNKVYSEEADVQSRINVVVKQIQQVQRTLEWLTNLRDGYTWGVFLRGISDPKKPGAVVTSKPLTDAAGKPVGTISWTYGFAGGALVVKSISYKFGTQVVRGTTVGGTYWVGGAFGFAVGEISPGRIDYTYNHAGRMTGAVRDGWSTIHVSTGDSATGSVWIGGRRP